jgi:replication-associated recombination protein RarA
VIGHRAARAYLERELPIVTLLHGPPSIGKWTLANHLADHHHVHKADRWLVERAMTMDTVRLVTHYAARAPHGVFKLVVARLDDCHSRVLNAMLKTLEEPPPRVRFLLTSHTRPIATVRSRAMCFELGELSVDELTDVYRAQGWPDHRARRAALYARGRVTRGYDAERADDHRAQVVTLLRAINTGDHEQFHAAFDGWDSRCSELLHTFITEALTRRWNTFAEADAAGIDQDRRRLWRMAAAVVRVRAVRPRLGVRAALEPFVTGR